MMNNIEEIFEKCQSTADWYGLVVKSVNDRNDFEDTPLHTVCTWGDVQAAKILLDAGANPNAQGDQGATPIFNAIISKNTRLIKLLLGEGASKKSKIFGETSPYDYAKSLNASSDVLRLLK